MIGHSQETDGCRAPCLFLAILVEYSYVSKPHQWREDLAPEISYVLDSPVELESA